jgi:hypothetical protein
MILRVFNFGPEIVVSCGYCFRKISGRIVLAGTVLGSRWTLFGKRFDEDHPGTSLRMPLD